MDKPRRVADAMTGPASHNDPIRTERCRRWRLALITGAAFLASLAIAVAVFPHTEIGRMLNVYLDRLGDPRSWIP